jgi:hypothetical protein
LNTLYSNNNNYNTSRTERENLKLKTINLKQNKRKMNVLNNLNKIRRTKDIDSLLFKPNKHIFNEIKAKLLKKYKNEQKIPKEYLEQNNI